jgi:hypothetical protein
MLGFLPPVDTSTNGAKGKEIRITPGKPEVFLSEFLEFIFCP